VTDLMATTGGHWSSAQTAAQSFTAMRRSRGSRCREVCGRVFRHSARSRARAWVTPRFRGWASATAASARSSTRTS